MTEPGHDLATLLSGGRLTDAIGAMTERVRAKPADAASRTTLAELLCLAGAFDRADAQLAIVVQQTIDRPVALARMRHLIRAATAREAWFAEAAVPALLAGPSELQKAAIRLALAVQAGEPSGVTAALEQAEAMRPKCRGTVTGREGSAEFTDIRDADDASAWFLEILTHDGTYMWTDLATVEKLTFKRPERPIDLLWRETRMVLSDGRVADIVVPAQYVARDADEAQRLAASTDWQDGPGGTVHGLGQRLFLFDEDARPILELDEIRLRPAP